MEIPASNRTIHFYMTCNSGIHFVKSFLLFDILVAKSTRPVSKQQIAVSNMDAIFSKPWLNACRSDLLFSYPIIPKFTEYVPCQANSIWLILNVRNIPSRIYIFGLIKSSISIFKTRSIYHLRTKQSNSYCQSIVIKYLSHILFNKFKFNIW